MLPKGLAPPGRWLPPLQQTAQPMCAEGPVMHEVTGYYYSIFDMSKGFIWGVKCVLAVSPYKIAWPLCL